MESYNINLLVEDCMTKLNTIIQNCNLPVAVVYLILQNLTKEIEHQYIATINTLALQGQKEQEYTIDLTADGEEQKQ